MNTTTLDGSYLQRAHYVEDNLALQQMITPPEQWLKEQITVWQFPDEITKKLNGKLFSFEAIAKKHPEQLIDIRS